jgi:hypothetical protein
MLETLDDVAMPHPYLHSIELLDNNRSEQIATFSYQKFKFKLSGIASPIFDVYFLRGATVAQVTKKKPSLCTRG